MISGWAGRAAPGLDISVVLLRDTSRPWTQVESMLSCPWVRVSFDGQLDNRRLVYDKLARRISGKSDLLLANDAFELGMLARLRLPNPVAFVLHGDYAYYYELALRHEGQIGSFLCVSKAVERRLANLLPQRSSDIHLTYPVVPEPTHGRAAKDPDHPLRVLFVGRLTEEKGFSDLPKIDHTLKSAEVDVAWTIVAPHSTSVPQECEVWLASPRVTHIAGVPLSEMERIYLEHDVLAFPSRQEGFGICVLEAMKNGVVPIASRLEAGIPEMIDHERTGFTVEVGDWHGMAIRIATLAAEPALLQEMGSRARRATREKFNSGDATTSMTEAVLAARSGTAHHGSSPDYLSRLDQPWLPNQVVRMTRKLMQVSGISRRPAGRPRSLHSLNVRV